MNIPLTLNQEEQDAVTKATAEHNTTLPEGATPLTEQEYLAHVMTSAVQSWVSRYFDLAVERVKESYKERPYEERLAVLASLEQA